MYWEGEELEVEGLGDSLQVDTVSDKFPGSSTVLVTNELGIVVHREKYHSIWLPRVDSHEILITHKEQTLIL